MQSLNEIEIECLPSDIPENLSVDISNLGLGDSFKVSDLQLDEKFIQIRYRTSYGFCYSSYERRRSSTRFRRR